MVFSQLAFLFYFLPAVMLLYFGIKDIRFRNVLILVSGLVFYAWGEPFYAILMVISTLIDYTAGRFMDKYDSRPDIRRLCLIVSIVMNLSLLGLFKYSDFITDSVNTLLNTQLVNPVITVNKALNKILPLALDEKRVHLPIGISFFTFQSMSYTIDLYLRNIKVQKSPWKFAAYVTLFPQIVAGPIVRYEQVEKELDDRTVTPEKVWSGVGLFVKGLAKKVLIANNVGAVWSQVKGMDYLHISALTAWLGIIAFTLQIYFDFSGYSDMAVGMGRMMGFEFPKNFDHPYMSKSVSEFWRRWHITLGDWFRNYVYIPLGGNRKGKGRTLVNLMIVWALTGLWHGASWNFVLWGLYFGVLIVLERLGFGKILERLPRPLSILWTLFTVILGWVLFDTDSLPLAMEYIGAMFTAPAADRTFVYLISQNWPVLTAGVIGSTGAVYLLKRFLPKSENFRIAAVTVCEAAAIFLCTCSLVANEYNPFLYFRF